MIHQDSIKEWALEVEADGAHGCTVFYNERGSLVGYQFFGMPNSLTILRLVLTSQHTQHTVYQYDGPGRAAGYYLLWERGARAYEVYSTMGDSWRLEHKLRRFLDPNKARS